MERLGIPATLILTEPFVRLATRFSLTLGLNGYPSVAVPHPVASRTDEQLAQLADGVADQVARRLISG